MTRRVAITGATGFIGRSLTSHLVSRGLEVRAIVRPSMVAHGQPSGRSVRQRVHPNINRDLPAEAVVVTAPLERDALAPALRGVETVVHLAGVISASREDDYRIVNVEGTRAVAEAARRAGARLVHVSSLAAAGPAAPSRPRSEDDPPAPITAYGRSKLDSERALASIDGLKWIVLRPGVVYGPGDRAMLPLFLFAKRGILPWVGRTGAAYTLVHVADVVNAIESAVDADLDGDTIFVGHQVPVTARELLEEVRAVAGTRALVLRVPTPLARLAAAAGDVAGSIRGRPMLLNGSRYRELYCDGFVCRVDRLRERLGVVAEIGLREGLAQSAEWYRSEAWR